MSRTRPPVRQRKHRTAAALARGWRALQPDQLRSRLRPAPQLKEGELSLAEREIARVEATRAGGGVSALDASGAPSAGDAALAVLAEEERELLARLEAAGPDARALFEAFVVRKRELEEEVRGRR